MQIADKVFVVTGGGNGMGREVALQLIARGARVAAVDLNEAGLAETAALAGTGKGLTTHVVNVSDRKAVLALPPPSSRLTARSTVSSTWPASSSHS